MRYVTYRGRKQVAADLKPVYRAVNADAAAEALQAFDQTWGERYPMIAESWRARWEHIIPFLALPAELRRAVTPPTASRTSPARCAARRRGCWCRCAVNPASRIVERRRA
jgi:putative transposase